ncbi:alpha/beta hydrolase [Neolewinella aurantiaca]|uniref:Alpha/beta hydrolase n=1 Tax=Neolewinella aurantiaca TaxID=2602767 RepID=A0A5C7FNK3_9BACT|nr:alpha/beta hydrolase [Neolewinella aurantiaca]TXF89146.1 alpha/beta hydrolase [Neolewinella aurantiaca]
MRFLQYLTLFPIILLLTSCATAQNPATVTTWNYPFNVHYAEVNDSVRLAYVDEGTGPETLLFLHGLGSNLQAWQKTIAGLSNDYRCIALDLPGYGKSSQGDYAFGMSFFANQVAAFIESLGLKEVTLVGHSMGGQVAITLALQQPKYLKQLVLAAPAGLETFSAENRVFFATYVQPHIVRAATEAQIEANFAMNFYDMPEDARFMVEDRLEMREDSQAYHYYSEMIPRCVLGMLDEPVADRLAALDLPTLLIFGYEDQLIPNKLLHPELSVEAVGEFGQQSIQGSKLVFLNEAGHFVQWDQAQAFNNEVRAFIEKK